SPSLPLHSAVPAASAPPAAAILRSVGLRQCRRQCSHPAQLRAAPGRHITASEFVAALDSHLAHPAHPAVHSAAAAAAVVTAAARPAPAGSCSAVSLPASLPAAAAAAAVPAAAPHCQRCAATGPHSAVRSGPEQTVPAGCVCASSRGSPA